MSLLSSAKSVVQKVAAKVGSVVNSIGSALSGSGQTAAVANASNASIAPNKSVAPAQGPSSVSGLGGPQSTTINGVVGAYNPYSNGAAGAFTPYSTNGNTNIYTPSGGGAAGSYSGSVLGASTTNFTDFSSPSSLNSNILGGAYGASSYSGELSVPQANYTDYSGAMAGIQAGRKAVPAYGSVNPDGSVNKYDPNTGQSTDPNFDLAKILEVQTNLDAKNPAPNTQDIYQKQYEAAGIAQKQQAVNDLSATLDAITAKSQAEQLSVVGQGRGIPEAIIGGQQAQIAREAAIQALPIAAQLAHAQGNLQLAQSHLDTMYNLAVKDAENAYQHRVSLNNSIVGFATDAEKRRLQQLDSYAASVKDAQTSLAKTKLDMLSTAISQGAPTPIINAIRAAQTPEEAIRVAGQYGNPAKATTSGNISGEQLKQAINKQIATPAFQALSDADKAAYIQSQGGTPYDFGF